MYAVFVPSAVVASRDISQACESDQIISNNLQEVTNYRPYYLWKSIEMLWEILILLLQQIG